MSREFNHNYLNQTISLYRRKKKIRDIALGLGGITTFVVSAFGSCDCGRKNKED